MTRIRLLWQGLLASLWFVPSLIVALGVALALLAIWLDDLIGAAALSRVPWLFGASAEGARNLLAAVAGSMATVAGVAFSITVVVLSQAASQFSSRVLRNFMGNRVNQAVLGVLMGVFAYCMVVLRSVHGGEEAFVPSIAILGGIVLAFVAIGFFVYFIHHTASSIQASRVLASLAADTVRSIDACFPNPLQPAEEAPEVSVGSWRTIRAPGSGYVQSVDTRALLRCAAQQRTVIRMEKGVGDFVIEGEPLVSVEAASGAGIDERRLLVCFVFGPQRTVEQDAGFGIRQIVDVAMRALSPGINDTTTAQMCVDQLSAILARVASREIERTYCYRDQQLRLIAHGASFAGLVSDAFTQISDHGRDNAAILAHVLAAMARIVPFTPPSRLHVLVSELQATREVITESRGLLASDRERLLLHAESLLARLR